MNRPHLREFIQSIQTAENRGQGGFDSDVLVTAWVLMLGWSVLDEAPSSIVGAVPGAKSGYVCRNGDGDVACALMASRTTSLSEPSNGLRTLLGTVPMVVRTDGLVFSAQVSDEHGEVHAVDTNLREGEPEHLASTLLTLFGRASVLDGSGRRAVLDIVGTRKAKACQERLAVLFNELLEAGDSLLVDLLVETAQEHGLPGVHGDLAKAVEQGFGRKQGLATERGQRQPPRPNGRRESCKNGAGFRLGGRWHSAPSARRVLQLCLIELEKEGAGFLARLDRVSRGRSRRLVAKDPLQLYPGRPALCRKEHLPLVDGWVVATNHSKQAIGKHLQLASVVAGRNFGQDLVVELG